MLWVKIDYGIVTQRLDLIYNRVVYCKERKLNEPHLKINSKNSFAQ